MKTLLKVLRVVLVWLFNLPLLVLGVYGILLISSLLFWAMLSGLMPLHFLVAIVVLMVVSILCIFYGIRRFRTRPLQLIQLFYGVQAPLFILGLYPLYLLREVRLFQLPELAPTSLLVVSTVAVCILAFFLETLMGYAAQHRWLAWLQLLIHSLLPGVGIYVGLLLLFYALPFAIDFSRLFFVAPIRLLGQGLLLQPAISMWLLPLCFLLFCLLTVLVVVFSSVVFCFTAGPILAMPFALASFYLLSGWRVLRAFAAQYRQARALQGAIAMVSAWIVLCVSLGLQPQPQLRAFNLLAQPALDDNIRQELLAKSKPIRAGLLNAYLSAYRYLSFKDENNNIRAKYKKLGLPESTCQFLQESYNHLMSPFLYNGSRADIAHAERLYAQFFDAPIQKAERETLQLAVQNPEDADVNAGLLNIDREKVWLAQQQVNVRPEGDWAEVELYEVYENQTDEVEEIVYSFSLPESAVVTGLWLGETADRKQRFPFQISPRGAAQKTYTAQVRRVEPIDPALLEQVGPQNYRLRAFPVFPQAPMHLWLTYRVMQQKNGWPLPQLAEKRNLFWTADTKRKIDDKTVESSQDVWLPAVVPAEQPYQPTLHRVNLLAGYSVATQSSTAKGNVFQEGQGYSITAQPLTVKDYAFPQGQRFAVVLDSSRSMADRTELVVDAFSWLQEQGFADGNLDNNEADVYLTASVGGKARRIDGMSQFDPDKVSFYGTLQIEEMLQQFERLKRNTAYDGILLLTDEGSYELSPEQPKPPVLKAPLWLVHLGALPSAYTDTVLAAVQASGGGVATGIEEALQRQATKATLGAATVSVVDGYAWSVEATVEATNDAVSADKGFDALAARQLIRALGGERPLEQLDELDRVHAIARNYNIVSPYSAAIVLVNEQQKELLRQLEASTDRFQRSIEDGNEQWNDQRPISVPEPGAIVGLVTVAFILIVKRHRPKSTQKQRFEQSIEAGQ